MDKELENILIKTILMIDLILVVTVIMLFKFSFTQQSQIEDLTEQNRALSLVVYRLQEGTTDD